VCYNQTGRQRKVSEFDDCVTDEEINTEFFEWLCEETDAGWGEVEE
jgi:hypothetical protein